MRQVRRRHRPWLRHFDETVRSRAVADIHSTSRRLRPSSTATRDAPGCRTSASTTSVTLTRACSWLPARRSIVVTPSPNVPIPSVGAGAEKLKVPHLARTPFHCAGWIYEEKVDG